MEHWNDTSSQVISASPVFDVLRRSKQFVNWSEIWRDDKIRKMPINPHTGGAASVSDPSSWAFGGVAIKAARRRSQGVGFVLTATDSFVVVDLDHCRDLATGAIEQWSAEIVARFASYTEISPSGTGLHIWMRGSLPDGGRKKGRIEVYDSARFITITGLVLPDHPALIEDRNEELHRWHAETFGEQDPVPFRADAVARPTLALDDQVVLDRAFAARNGASVQRLYAGDTSAHDGDDSKADLALIRCLAFWTQDRSQLDRIFRTSALYREKWERADYRDRTIDRALANLTARYDPERNAPRSTTTEPDAPLSGDALHSAEARILKNRDLGQARLVAIVLARVFAQREAKRETLALPLPINLSWLASEAGLASSSASAHLSKLCDLGLVVKTYRRHRSFIRANGVIVPTRTELLVMPKASSAGAFAEDAACFTKPAPIEGANGWGGKRANAGRKRCLDHPESSITRTVIDTCDECETVISETVVTIAPPSTPASERADFRAIARDSELDCQTNRVRHTDNQDPNHEVSSGVYATSVNPRYSEQLRAVHERLIAGARS